MIIDGPMGMKMEEFIIGEYTYQYLIDPNWTAKQAEMERDFRFRALEEYVRKVA